MTDNIDEWRCRFILRAPDGEMTDAMLITLLQQVGAQHRWGYLEKLQVFDGVEGFTKSQGED